MAEKCAVHPDQEPFVSKVCLIESA